MRENAGNSLRHERVKQSPLKLVFAENSTQHEDLMDKIGLQTDSFFFEKDFC